jgi:response regulator RpfG family c-di-GMP phosphodiesterase
MTERILCVDDDPNILHAYQRTLRKRFHIEPALGGEEAFLAVTEQGPYAVVVADMRMPGMNGAELLAKVAAYAPDTVRLMLSGNADQQTAIDAVNEGHIFRFLTKPCPPETFAKALEAALGQHRLIVAERDLLSKTLAGAVRVATEMLGQVNPTALGRATRVRRIAGELCACLGVERAWAVEIAAMLSQIGCASIPEETLNRFFRGEPLSRSEVEALATVAETGSALVANIPRLEEVAAIIRHQDAEFAADGDRGAPPADRPPLGSRILKVALDFDALLYGCGDPHMALAQINDREDRYDPQVVEALRKTLAVDDVRVIRRVKVQNMVDGAILAEDVRSLGETLLCARGLEVTPFMRARLKTYLSTIGVRTPIAIMVPREAAECPEPST